MEQKRLIGMDELIEADGKEYRVDTRDPLRGKLIEVEANTTRADEHGFPKLVGHSWPEHHGNVQRVGRIKRVKRSRDGYTVSVLPVEEVGGTFVVDPEADGELGDLDDF
ncbi:hypothetical protein [Gordonia rhizosphera]|uniref:Uncharacterized protein n=1 Tax=Gordonia rhizosphera NBRC 16068 TaxID=1108045 RepID=K6WH96_9ACTN|nr:hypothetical protein [Gordonia rhizosphera]GAB93156.1 hypothetical protein GORHZ_207_00050 [Gordonia rhizosphera NBRC 16068]